MSLTKNKPSTSVLDDNLAAAGGAGLVGFTPTGALSAATVQAMGAELDALITALTAAKAVLNGLATIDFNVRDLIAAADISAGGTLDIQGNSTLTGFLAVLGTTTLNGDINPVGALLRGLEFPNPQVASADPNTLDDYEEGTFTPYLADSSLSDSEGQTYSLQTGKFTKIGNVMHITIDVTVTGKGTLTAGDIAYVGGLPYIASDNASLAIVAEKLLVTAGEAAGAFIGQNENYIELAVYSATTGAVPMLISETTANLHVTISGAYHTPN